MSYRTVRDTAVYEFTEKKSRFIGRVFYTPTEEDARAWGLPDLATYLAMTDVQWSNYAHARKSDVVREMAWKYGSHIVDAFNGFPPVSSPENRTAYWSTDHIHMNDQGNVDLAGLLEREGILVVFGG